jgi:hypothetical protein
LVIRIPSTFERDRPARRAAFVGEEYVDENWSARCAATVRLVRSAWRDLPEADVDALTEAYKPGFEPLRTAGLGYET